VKKNTMESKEYDPSSPRTSKKGNVTEGNTYDPSKQLSAKKSAVVEGGRTYDPSQARCAKKTTTIESTLPHASTGTPARVERLLHNPVKMDEMNSCVEIAEEIEAELQGTIDSNACDLAATIMVKSQFRLEYLMDDGNWKYAGVVTFLYGTVALINLHVARHVMQYDYIRISGDGCQDGLKISTDELVLSQAGDHPVFGQRDVALMHFPIRARQFPDIRKHFANVDDFQRIREVECGALLGFLHTRDVVHRMAMTGRVIAVDRDVNLRNADGEVYITLRDAFNYDVQTVKGDCGSLLIAFSSSLQRKIIGMHCAGGPNIGKTGIATPISQNFIKYLAEGIEREVGRDSITLISAPLIADAQLAYAVKLGESTNDQLCVNITSSSKYNGMLAAVGKFPKEKGVYAPGKTEISPSPIGESITVNKTTQALVGGYRDENGVFVDTMYQAIQKANVTPVMVPQVFLEASEQYVRDRNSKGGDEYRRLFTKEEAIQGIIGDPYVEPINRKTSPGYPYVLQKKVGGKRHWLGEDEHYDFNNPELAKDMDHIISEAKQGRRTEVIFVDTLKDERRTLEKAKKPRLFETGPMAFNLVMRMYFGGYTAFRNKNKIIHDSCVGINAYSMEWTQLAKRLSRFGKKNILAGDFSNYDGTLGSTVLASEVEDINEFYRRNDFTEEEEKKYEEDCRVRRVCFSNIMFSIHLTRDELTVWIQSQPSGNIMTVNLNSDVNTKYSVIAYLILADRFAPEHCNMKSYQDYIVENNYGDDNVKAVHHSIMEWYNMQNLTWAYAQLGLKYTDEEKRSDVTEFRSLEDVSFLKRTFRWDETQQRYCAPLSLDTVLEMAQWVRGKTNHHELCKDTMEMAAYELSHHPKSVFDEYMPKFREAAKYLDDSQQPVFQTYAMYRKTEMKKYVLDIM